MGTPEEHNQNQERAATREGARTSQHAPRRKSRPATPVPFQEAAQPSLELLATLGHEFRTPLAAIKGYSSLLLRQDALLSSEERREFLQVIQQAGQRLERLTERLLEMAHLEAGVTQLDESVIDIPALAREAIARAHQQVPAHLLERLTLHLHVRDTSRSSTTTAPPVSGDRRRLRDVLDHLLENAIRFSPKGGRIDVVVQPVPPTQSISGPGQESYTSPWVEICVCDYGIGIPTEHLERIFDRFHQVDTSLTREVNGLGLGLAICQQVVALHQGRIWAESCPAGGSAFHVWLPVTDSTPAS